jgi:hypothetical protein
MNKREIRKALEQNKFVTFSAAKILLPHGQKALLGDLFVRLKRLEADMNKIRPDRISGLLLTHEIVQDGILIGWVVVPENQGNLLSTGQNFDEGMLQELKEKLILATLEAVTSIDAGNELAFDATQDMLTADDVQQRLQASSSPRITRNVAARAPGPQVTITFSEGERHLGGNIPAPPEYTNPDRILIEKCRLVRWLSDKEVILQTDLPPNNPELLRYFKKQITRVRIAKGTIEATILDCAAFAETSFDIDVSTGLILKSGRMVLQLSTIHNRQSIFCAAQTRLDELRGNL